MLLWMGMVGILHGSGRTSGLHWCAHADSRERVVSQNFNSFPRFAIFDAVAVLTTGIEMAAGCCVLPARRAAGRLPIEVAISIPYVNHLYSI